MDVSAQADWKFAVSWPFCSIQVLSKLDSAHLY